LTGLSLWTHLSLKDMIQMNEEYNEIKNDMNSFQHLEDSMAGNPNFRKRLIKEARTLSEFKQMRQNQGAELRRKIAHFQNKYPNRQKMITEHKILDAARNAFSIVFVVMAIPFFIHVLKRR